MATIYLNLSGTFKWAKRQKDTKYGNYSVDFYPSTEAKKALKESGLKLKLKEDDDGETYYKLRRPDSKLIKGETVTFGPPKFFIREDGNPDPVPYDGIVGNGSSGQVRIQVYDIQTTGDKGYRWEALLVEKLVEYVRPNAGASDQLAPPVW